VRFGVRGRHVDLICQARDRRARQPRRARGHAPRRQGDQHLARMHPSHDARRTLPRAQHHDPHAAPAHARIRPRQPTGIAAIRRAPMSSTSVRDPHACAGPARARARAIRGLVPPPTFASAGAREWVARSGREPITPVRSTYGCGAVRHPGRARTRGRAVGLTSLVSVFNAPPVGYDAPLLLISSLVKGSVRCFIRAG